MTAFLIWYLFVSLLGWLTFPLAYRLFPALADRGYTLARAAGMLLWGYIFWLFVSLGFARNDLGGIFLALVILILLSLWSSANHKSEIVNFIKSNPALITAAEILFLLAFAFLAFVRSANPELASTEKPMELAFINGILKSETFPPQDPWLSGYAISYYYFGYVMTAMLARLADINGSMAHNLMTALIFALGAVGAFGILYNLLNSVRRRQTADRPPSSVLGLSLLAPLFLLLVSNFEALLEVLHKRGLGWLKSAETGEWSGPFWTWLDMKELSQPPAEPLGWMPDRYLWWWRASRVLQDYDMLGGHREVIDEFPFFSFLLGDLHPHVLAIPFGLLAVSVALNIFLGGWRGRIEALGLRLHINAQGFLFSALVLGGLAFLNTWDILISAALIVSAYVLWRANEAGWSWSRLEDVFLLGLPLGAVSLLLYFPFYLGFSSQAGGVLPNFMYPTRGIHLWVMWGTLLLPIFSYLLYLISRSRSDGDSSDIVPRPNWKLGFSLGLGFTLFLLLLTLILGAAASILEKDFVAYFLASQNMTAAQFLGATTLRRLAYIGSLITLLAVLIPALAFLFPRFEARGTSNELQDASSASTPSSLTFTLLLLALGALLILVPDFVFLRDQFGYRINTVFKFYYQAWMLWSLAAAFGTAMLLQTLRGMTFANVGFRVLTGLVVFCGLLYPVFGLMTKTGNFKPPLGYTLDDFDRIKRENPDDAAGIEFLRSAPEGIIVEAVGDSYSYYARVSAYTGLQTVLGWPGHEAQWRGGYEPQDTRRDDILTLYTTPRWEEAQDIIRQYNIRYIYVGPLERISMPVSEEKFFLHLTPVFQQGNVVIYEVP
ncbi:MAG: hypothetical protein DPW18_20565 [Chloroflexi bacterium]|nr:hypothetical protein [Chloroflexota bacterium]MDL1942206.1 hypothetical protein [Chloroflexi bacterium CFX2]